MMDAPTIGTAGDEPLRDAICDAILAFMARHHDEPIGSVSEHLGIVCLEYATASLQAAHYEPKRFAHLVVTAFGQSAEEFQRILADAAACAQPSPDALQ